MEAMIPRDLTCFVPAPMPSCRGAGDKQCLVNDLMGMPRYTSYYNAASAMAEVTYSRLCDAIGLTCVRSDYATGLQLPDDPWVTSHYVSVSEYQPEWIAWESVVDSEVLIENADTESWSKYYGLGLLLLQPHWNDRRAGYIRQDGSFIKANNGPQFFSFELRKFLEGQSSAYHMHNAPVSVTQYISESVQSPQMIDVLGPMSRLTDVQIEQFSSTPDNWDEGAVGCSFFANRLKMGRDCAKRILNALDDDVERFFEGL